VKKLASILLILCLVLPFAGTYTWLKVQKRQVKRSVKRMMMQTVPREDLVQLAFSRADAGLKLRWEHSKEFEYRGEMFDVVDSVCRNDSVIYTCWWDREETQLNRGLRHVLNRMAGNDPVRKERQDRLSDFYRNLMNPSTPNRGFSLPAHQNTYAGFREHTLLPPFIPPPEKPPKAV